MSKRFPRIGWAILVAMLCLSLSILPACGEGEGEGEGTENPYIGSGLLDGNGIPLDFFSDRNTRVGFSYAFDYDTYIEQALSGQGECVASPIVKGLYGYCATTPKYSYCMTLARWYLEHSGWGNLTDIGFKFTVVYNAGNLVRKAACDLLAESVNSLSPNIAISILPIAWNAYEAIFESGLLPMWQIGWLPDYPHADDYVVPFMQQGNAFSGPQSYGNATIDALITAAFLDPNPVTQLEKYAQLAQIYHDDAPAIMGAQPLARRYFTGHIGSFYYNPCETSYPGRILDLTKAENATTTAAGLPYKHAGTLTYDTIGDMVTLDPCWAYDTSSSQQIQCVYEPLLYYNRTSTTEFIPILATDTGTFNATDNTLTFTVRSGVNFTNNETMTAADVEYSIQRAMVINRRYGPQWMFYVPLLGVGGLDCRQPGNFTLVDDAITVDGNDVVFHLDSAGWEVPFKQILTQSWASVLEKDWCIAQGDWNGTQADVARVYRPALKSDTHLYEKMMGTGPWKLSSWTHGVSCILVKNTNYWNQGVTPVPFDNIVTNVYELWPTRKSHLLAGDADIVDVPATNYADMDPELGKLNYYFNLPSLNIDAFFFNFAITEP